MTQEPCGSQCTASKNSFDFFRPNVYHELNIVKFNILDTLLNGLECFGKKRPRGFVVWAIQLYSKSTFGNSSKRLHTRTNDTFTVLYYHLGSDKPSDCSVTKAPCSSSLRRQGHLLSGTHIAPHSPLTLRQNGKDDSLLFHQLLCPILNPSTAVDFLNSEQLLKDNATYIQRSAINLWPK